MASEMARSQGTSNLEPVTESVRLGLVLPSVNCIAEPFCASIMPAEHSFHTTRMLLPEKLTPEAVRRMDDEDGARALHQIASVRPHAAIYACFASSVVFGVERDRHLAMTGAKIAGCPVETAAGAAFLAMRALEMRCIAVISPYAEEIDVAEHALLNDAGFDVVSAHSFGITDSFNLAQLSPRVMIEAGCKLGCGVDGIFISCMNTPSHMAILPVEDATGLPVVTATSATLWAALRLSGYTADVTALGRLGRMDLPKAF